MENLIALKELLGIDNSIVQHADLKQQCPICDSNQITLAYWAKLKGVRIRYDRCHDCGYIFQNPLLHQDVLTYIYQSSWYWGLANKSDVGYINYLADADRFVKDYQRRYSKLAA